AARPNACTLPLSHRKFTHESTAPTANPTLPRHPQRHPAQAAPTPPSSSVSHSMRRSAALPNGSFPILAPYQEPPDHFKHPAGKSKQAHKQSQNRRAAESFVEQITQPGTDHHPSHQHARQIHNIGKAAGNPLRAAPWRTGNLRISIFIDQRVRRARSTNKSPSG